MPYSLSYRHCRYAEAVAAYTQAIRGEYPVLQMCYISRAECLDGLGDFEGCARPRPPAATNDTRTYPAR